MLKSNYDEKLDTM